MTVRELLDGVRFTDSGTRSALLAELGFRHGFEGRSSAGYNGHHLKQVHGTTILEAGPDSARDAAPRAEADGLYATTRGVIVGVKTADCVPVLIADRDRRVVMAVHAGWRGLAAGILARAVTRARELGFPAARLVAAIGPSISRDIYEVGPEVIDAFVVGQAALGAAAQALCVAKGMGDRWHFDTQIAATLSLKHLGVATIEVIQACTYKESDLWHSYRLRHALGDPVKEFNWSWIEL